MAARLLPLIAVACLSSLAVAMFEEDMGAKDWQVSNIGRVRHAAFVKQRLFVGTDAGVLAALDPATGAIKWRQVLPPGDTVDAIALRRRNLFTVTGGGRLASMWEAGAGSLKWDVALVPGAGEVGGPVSAEQGAWRARLWLVVWGAGRERRVERGGGGVCAQMGVCGDVSKAVVKGAKEEGRGSW